MKINLTLHHDTFEHLAPVGVKIPDFGLLTHRIAMKARVGFAKLLKALRPIGFEEAYLAESQNLAELERRMLELQTPHNRFSSSYW